MNTPALRKESPASRRILDWFAAPEDAGECAGCGEPAATWAGYHKKRPEPELLFCGACFAEYRDGYSAHCGLPPNKGAY